MSADNFLTLSDYQQRNPSLLYKGIVQCFRKESKFLDSIKILTTGTMRVRNWREGSMSKIGNRKIGEARPVVLHQKPDEVEDSMYIYSNEIKVPTQNVDYKDPNQIYDPLNSNIKKTTKSMARQITSDFINGTPTVNPDGIVGLKYRIDTYLSSDQKIPASGTNGTALDLDPSGANYAANIRQFKRILDTAKDQVAETPDFIFCNNTFINMQSSIWADSNYLKVTEDSLHRVFQDWDGVKYIDMGFEYDDTNKVITDSEDAYGAAGTPGTDHCTSIYLVKMGPEYWAAVQAAAMKIYDTHKDADNINYITQFDWEIGQLITHPRSVVRLYGLKMA